jgi:hypothetical protein
MAEDATLSRRVVMTTRSCSILCRQYTIECDSILITGSDLPWPAMQI